jgi:hypothetical protein
MISLGFNYESIFMYLPLRFVYRIRLICLYLICFYLILTIIPPILPFSSTRSKTVDNIIKISR